MIKKRKTIIGIRKIFLKLNNGFLKIIIKIFLKLRIKFLKLKIKFFNLTKFY
jgi:hypothetical protein